LNLQPAVTQQQQQLYAAAESMATRTAKTITLIIKRKNTEIKIATSQLQGAMATAT